MARKGILFETLNEVKSLNIQKEDDGLMHLSGVFGVCGVKNNNQRVYSRENYGKMVESMQERLKKAPIPGELEHPSSMNICTENISHRIDSISIDENGVVSGEITLLNTPKGKIAQAIVEGGLPLFISSRAAGQVDRNGNVTLETLQTYDLVGSPGFSQAELHLNENQCYECICEGMDFIGDKNDDENNTNENNNENMDNETLKQIQEQLEELKGQVEYLTEQNNTLQEQLDEKQDINLESLAEGIQSWIVEEYSPTLQNWIVEEYSQKVQNWVTDNYSEQVQKWVVEEFAPQVQKWITEEYDAEAKKYVNEEFAQKVQDWVVKEYSANLQKWIVEEAATSIKEDIKNEFANTIAESKQSKLSNIDAILEMLDNAQASQKPVYGRKANMVAEENAPKYIKEMPADVRVKYDLANESVKEMIGRKAKLYDWSKDNAIQNFWESIDFDTVAQVKNNINEGLENITDEKERKIREQIRAWKNRN